MKRIESIFTNDHGRGSTVFAVIAILALTVAVVAVIVMSGEKRSVVADSLPAPVASVPQDPVTALSVYMQLQVEGELLESDIVYYSERQDWTHILEYNASITRPADRGSSLSAGRSLFNPIVVTKFVDSTSPSLMRALRTNGRIDATFEFERFHQDDGTIETYYKIQIENGRLTGIQKNSGLVGGDTETLSIVFNTIRESHEVESVEDEWQWDSAN